MPKKRQRNGVAPYSPAALAFRRGAQSAGHGAKKGGASVFMDAASLPLTLRQGWKPEGQRRRSWLCAKHDSPPGRPGSQQGAAHNENREEQQDR